MNSLIKECLFVLNGIPNRSYHYENERKKTYDLASRIQKAMKDFSIETALDELIELDNIELELNINEHFGLCDICREIVHKSNLIENGLIHETENESFICEGCQQS